MVWMCYPYKGVLWVFMPAKQAIAKKMQAVAMAVLQRIKTQLHRDDPRQLKKEIAWLVRRMRRFRWQILCVGLLGLAGTLLGLGSSVASKHLIDAVTGHSAGTLIPAAAAMGGMMLGSLLFQGVSSRVGAAIHIRVKNEMQRNVYTRILRAGWETLEPYRSGDLLNRLNSDVAAVSDGTIQLLPALCTSLVKFFGAFGIIAYYDPVMALIALLGVPVMLGLSRMLMRKLRDHNLAMKALSSEVMAFQEDSLRNLTSIKAFSLTDRFESELQQLQLSSVDAFLSYNAFQIRMTSSLSLVSMAVTASCFGWGVWQLWHGRITYGSLTLFLQLAATLRSAFSTLASLAQQMISMTTSAGRILAVEELKPEPQAVPEGLEEETALDIRLEQVCFRYQDGDIILDPFDLEARHGDLIALTGPSGEGKTTLLRLLLGLVEPVGGAAVLAGGSGRTYPISAGTRCAFAYVPQGNSIFPGTIADNLRLVKPEATDEELEDALKTACAWEFVSRFPEGLEHRLGAGGRGVSEGQAQRLAIARALLRKAPILLLDEATSGLDMATERRLLDNLRLSGLLKTCILVTHRPESARFCSRTYEVHHRRVTEVCHGNET